jgi:hypothetical protein
LFKFAADVYDGTSGLARPCVEWHGFGVVYVRFANVYPI